MLKGEVKIVNRLGLHARAAAQLVKLASKFESEIKLFRPDEMVCADAKSILSLLTLAASQGTSLKLEVLGTDEETAFSEVLQIFTNGFGEDI